MQILYLSALASQKAIDEARERDKSFCGFAIQKFGRLLTEGFAANGCEVTALSTFYLPKVGFYYHRKSENCNGVTYKYISSLSCGILRHIWLVITCFFRVLSFGLTQRKDKALVCDVLNVSACVGALAAAKLTRLRCVGLMTDMPGMLVYNNNTKETLSLSARVNRRYLSQFTHYIFMTEQANEAVNTKKRPYVVMEGCVDNRMGKHIEKQTKEKRIIIYAGGLYERYGLKMLVDGFIKADVKESELWLYGDGHYVEELKAIQQRDSRIRYYGIRPNDEIVDAEQKAVLLVNPRPTHEDFTKYSFPSKNMEYMVSGTAVLTTRLPGMPEEYYPYVYLFDEETTDGYAKTIRSVLSLPIEELNRKGQEARQWVLDNKNNVAQTANVLRLIEGLN